MVSSIATLSRQAVFLGVMSIASVSQAATINIDINGDPGNDTTHVGADGILSGTGTTWNGVEINVDIVAPSFLADEDGASTSAEIVWNGTASGGTDGSSTNELQDSLTFGEFSVRGLDPSATYDIAIYAGIGSSPRFTDSTGTTTIFSCTNSPTYALPGTEGEDYCLLSGRTPVDVGGGEIGFTFDSSDGSIAGVQIRATSTMTTPTTVNVPLPAWALLTLLTLLAGIGSRRQFRKQS